MKTNYLPVEINTGLYVFYNKLYRFDNKCWIDNKSNKINVIK